VGLDETICIGVVEEPHLGECTPDSISFVTTFGLTWVLAKLSCVLREHPVEIIIGQSCFIILLRFRHLGFRNLICWLPNG
jgi:hypothetical protein